MSLTPQQFEDKKDQMDHEKLRNALAKFSKLLEDPELVPYGSSERAFLDTLIREVSFLEKGDYTDFGRQRTLEAINGLTGEITKQAPYAETTAEKGLKDLFMRQKVYPERECYEALEAVDEFFELELAKQVQYGTANLAEAKENARKEAERKKQQEEERRLAEEKRKEAERLAEEKGRSWLNYVRLHRPEEGKQYTPAQQAVLLSKMMVAANIHASNAQKPREQKTAFDLSAARKYSAKLSEQWAFKHIAGDPVRMKRMMKMEPADLAKETQRIRRPFAGMTLEQRKAKIRELQSMLPYMDKKDGRSTKYKQMYESIEGISAEQLNNLEDCDDPKKNGEALLQNIFDSTEKYQKGKKSLRSKEDQQCRFDQSVDILVCLGRSTDAAKDMTEGLIDRINKVRLDRRQPNYISSFCGEKEHFQEHSNATRLYELQRQDYLVRKNRGEPDLTEPQNPWAEPQKAEPVNERVILPKNENATMLDYEKYKESPESLNLFTGDSGDFIQDHENMNKSTWEAYKNIKLTKDFAKNLIAGALATKDTPLLYSKAWKNIGCDENVFRAKFNEYMKDTAVDALAEKLRSPEERMKYFPDEENMSFEDLDIKSLEQDYQQIANPAPVL